MDIYRYANGKKKTITEKKYILLLCKYISRLFWERCKSIPKVSPCIISLLDIHILITNSLARTFIVIFFHYCYLSLNVMKISSHILLTRIYSQPTRIYLTIKKTLSVWIRFLIAFINVTWNAIIIKYTNKTRNRATAFSAQNVVI